MPFKPKDPADVGRMYSVRVTDRTKQAVLRHSDTFADALRKYEPLINEVEALRAQLRELWESHDRVDPFQEPVNYGSKKPTKF
jgi:hypothetical protein